MTIDTPSVGEILRREETFAAGGGAFCPPVEELAEGEIETLDGSRRQWLENHLAVCPRCQAEKELASIFERPPAGGAAATDLRRIQRRLENESPVRPGRSIAHPKGERLQGYWTSRTIRFAAAAVLILSIGAVGWRLTERAPTVRWAEDDVMRGAFVELIAPADGVREAPTAFSWTPVGDAARYRLQVESVTGDIVWQVDSESPRVPVPARISRGFQPAVRYRWRVEALDARSRTMARSPRQVFWVIPVAGRSSQRSE